MNGAESLVTTLVGGGVDVCFTNPGTSEMHFVAALDRVDGMRSVLCLFEGVVSGAADGYWRMARRPSATLLHLGPGLGNAVANLHNAKKAHSGIVNIVGEHATFHIEHDAPLTADIEGIAWPVSHWVHTSRDSTTVAEDGARAIAEAMAAPGRIATLILPGDTAWERGERRGRRARGRAAGEGGRRGRRGGGGRRGRGLHAAAERRCADRARPGAGRGDCGEDRLVPARPDLQCRAPAGCGARAGRACAVSGAAGRGAAEGHAYRGAGRREGAGGVLRLSRPAERRDLGRLRNPLPRRH